MLELARYPSDYDGMIVGAPYFDIASELGTTLTSLLAELRSPGAAIPPRLWTWRSRIIMDKCDSQDGVKDGLFRIRKHAISTHIEICRGAALAAVVTTASPLSRSTPSASYSWESGILLERLSILAGR